MNKKFYAALFVGLIALIMVPFTQADTPVPPATTGVSIDGSSGVSSQAFHGKNGSGSAAVIGTGTNSSWSNGYYNGTSVGTNASGNISATSAETSGCNGSPVIACIFQRGRHNTATINVNSAVTPVGNYGVFKSFASGNLSAKSGNTNNVASGKTKMTGTYRSSSYVRVGGSAN